MAVLESLDSDPNNESDQGHRKKRNRGAQQSLGYPYRGSYGSGSKQRDNSAQPQSSLGNDYTHVSYKSQGNREYQQNGQHQGQNYNRAPEANVYTAGNNNQRSKSSYKKDSAPPFGMPAMTIRHPKNQKPSYRQMYVMQSIAPGH